MNINDMDGKFSLMDLANDPDAQAFARYDAELNELECDSSSPYYDDVNDKARGVRREVEQQLAIIDEKLAQADDADVIQRLSQQRDELINGWNDFVSKANSLGKGDLLGGFASVISKKLEGLEAEIEDIAMGVKAIKTGAEIDFRDFIDHATSGGGGQNARRMDACVMDTPAMADVDDPASCGGCKSAGAASSTTATDSSDDASSTESTSSTSSSDGASSTEATGKIGDMSADEMIAKMKNDPQAVSDYLESLSPMDQQLAMQNMQQRMQEMNRMFSMMSSIQKAMHDTAKAAINNMRV